MVRFKKYKGFLLRERSQFLIFTVLFCKVCLNDKIKLSQCMPWKGSGGRDLLILDLGVNGGEWSASRTDHLTLVRDPSVPLELVARWNPEPLWTCWRRINLLAPAGIRSLDLWVVQPTAGHYTDRTFTKNCYKVKSLSTADFRNVHFPFCFPTKIYCVFVLPCVLDYLPIFH